MTIFFFKYYDESDFDKFNGDKVEFFESLQKCFARIKELVEENNLYDEGCQRFYFENNEKSPKYYTIQFNKTDSKYLCDKLNEINKMII